MSLMAKTSVEVAGCLDAQGEKSQWADVVLSDVGGHGGGVSTGTVGLRCRGPARRGE